MVGEITNREQLGWQLRASKLLTQLLEHGARDGLPPVAWTVGHAGASLVANCYGADRRTEWEAWRTALAAVPWPEYTNAGGVVHLHAVAKRLDGLVDVAVVANVFPGGDGGGAS